VGYHSSIRSLNDKHMGSVNLILHNILCDDKVGTSLSCAVTIWYSIIGLNVRDIIKTGTLLDQIGEIVIAIQVGHSVIEAQHTLIHTCPPFVQDGPICFFICNKYNKL